MPGAEIGQPPVEEIMCFQMRSRLFSVLIDTLLLGPRLPKEFAGVWVVPCCPRDEVLPER